MGERNRDEAQLKVKLVQPVPALLPSVFLET